MVSFIFYCLTATLIGAGNAAFKTEFALGYLGTAISFSGALTYVVLGLIHTETSTVSTVFFLLYAVLAVFLVFMVQAKPVRNRYATRAAKFNSVVRCALVNLCCLIAGGINLSIYLIS